MLPGSPGLINIAISLAQMQPLNRYSMDVFLLFASLLIFLVIEEKCICIYACLAISLKN